jgi:uncharacterized protein HemX
MMKKFRNSSLAFSSCLALALATWSPAQAQSTKPAHEKTMTKSNMMAHCQEMEEQKEKMMTERKAQDTELGKQISEMNSAPDDKKLGLLAAVVTRLVEQRSATDAQMETMHAGMMKHMMERMQMGKESMPHGPMLKGMGEASEKAHQAPVEE